jgi:hypothetical protein
MSFYPEPAKGERSVAHNLRAEFRPTLRLALPLVLAEIGWMTMGIVDTMMVGRLPDSAAAIGITPTVKSTTATSLVVDLAVAANATAGNNTLTVHSSGSPPQTATTTFFVQVPTKVVRFDSPPAAPGGIGPLQTPTDGDVVSLSGTVLATHQCGVYRNLLYDVVDQSGTSIEGTYTLTETFANFSGAGTPPSDRPLSVVPGFLISDTQSLTKNAPACLGPTDNQTFDQKFFATIAGSRFDLTTVIRIERGNFSGTLKVDTTITTP